jgi:hypothetical protein
MTARFSQCALAVCAVCAGCDSSHASFADDAAVGSPMEASAPARGTGGAASEADAATSTGGSLPPGTASCGGTLCQPGTSSVQSTACCTDSNECGLRIVLSSSCLPKKAPGGVDSRCAPFDIEGKITLPGCCSPTGCGALATFDDLGCIPNSDLSRATVPCTPDTPFP